MFLHLFLFVSFVGVLSWEFISGSKESNFSNVKGKLCTHDDDANNQPGSRAFAASFVDTEKGTLYLFGGAGYSCNETSASSLNDLWAFDLQSKNWRFVKGSRFHDGKEIQKSNKTYYHVENIPKSGSHGIEFPQDESVFLFGGKKGKFSTNELWQMDYQTENFRLIYENQEPYTKPKFVESEENIPQKLYRSSYVNVGPDFVYFFGGSVRNTSLEVVPFNTLYKFNPVNLYYTWVGGDFEPYGEGRYTEKKIYHPSNQPCARAGTKMWSMHEIIYIYGGFDEENFNEMWAFNVTKNEFALLQDSKNVYSVYFDRNEFHPQNTPGDRFFFGAWKANEYDAWNVTYDYLFLFGGRNFVETNDLWVYSVSRGDFMFVNGTVNELSNGNGHSPSGRRGMSVWVVDKDNVFIGFGNIGVNTMVHFNDLWRVDYRDVHCSGHGEFSKGGCMCYYNYTGKMCEYHVDDDIPKHKKKKNFFEENILYLSIGGGLLCLGTVLGCVVLIVCMCIFCSLFKVKVRGKKHENFDVEMPYFEENSLQVKNFNINKTLFTLPYDGVTLERQVGEGRTGDIIYVGKSHSIKSENSKIGVKMFNASFFNNQKEYNDFEEDIKKIKDLVHPNVINVYGLSINKDNRIRVMFEFCPNGSLRNFLSLTRFEENKKKFLDFQEKLRILIALCKVLLMLTCEKKFYFLDLSIDNIYLDKDHNPKLNLFHLYQYIKGKNVKLKIHPNFYSPEVLFGKGKEEKSIVFAFAFVMYSVYSENVNPFGRNVSISVERKIAHDPSFRAVFPRNRDESEQWIVSLTKKCWSEKAGDRPAFGEILEEFLKHYEKKQEKDKGRRTMKLYKSVRNSLLHREKPAQKKLEEKLSKELLEERNTELKAKDKEIYLLEREKKNNQFELENYKYKYEAFQKKCEQLQKELEEKHRMIFERDEELYSLRGGEKPQMEEVKIEIMEKEKEEDAGEKEEDVDSEMERLADEEERMIRKLEEEEERQKKEEEERQKKVEEEKWKKKKEEEKEEEEIKEDEEEEEVDDEEEEVEEEKQEEEEEIIEEQEEEKEEEKIEEVKEEKKEEEKVRKKPLRPVSSKPKPLRPVSSKPPRLKKKN